MNLKKTFEAAVIAGAVSLTPGCGEDNHCHGEVDTYGEHLSTTFEAKDHCEEAGNEGDLLTCADLNEDCEPVRMRCSEVNSRIHQVAEDGLVECIVQRDDN